MNRGSDRYPFCPFARVAGFNEAPIHESGKLGRAHARCDVDRASMRPRFMNRGSACAPGPSCPAGDRFNEAPIHESGKSQLDRYVQVSYQRLQ